MNLTSITLRNFKTFTDQTIQFNDVTDLIGRMGTGKTSVYDGFKFILFGKNAAGEARFGIHPIDPKTEKKLDVIPHVETVIDGHVLIREVHTEAPINRFWIDGEPKSMSAYKEYVDSMITEDRFRMLTDVHYTCKGEENNGMSEAKRRELLIDLAGNIGKPPDFDDLLEQLNGRKMLAYKKVVQDDKLRITKTRDANVVAQKERIRDVVRVVPEQEAEERRKTLTSEISALDGLRNGLLETEQERQRVLDQIQSIRTYQIGRETFLRHDTSRVETLINEKSGLATATQELDEDLQQKEWSLAEKKRCAVKTTEDRTDAQAELQHIIMQYKKKRDEKITKTEIEMTSCPKCQYSWPTPGAETEEIVQERYENDVESQKNALLLLRKKGEEKREAVSTCQVAIEKLDLEIAALESEVEIEKQAIENTKADNAVKAERLQAQIDADEKVLPENDPTWLEFAGQMEGLTVGESGEEQINIIEGQRLELSKELVKINKDLAKADRAVEDRNRMAELEEQERVYNKQILALEKRLNQIGEYIKCESQMIESAVNGMFKNVKWRLFRELKNGSIEDCCVPMLKGVEYSDLSHGEEILVGLDIARVVAAKYGEKVPLFVDNAESYSPDIDWNGQVIRLIHKKSQRTLKIV